MPSIWLKFEYIQLNPVFVQYGKNSRSLNKYILIHKKDLFHNCVMAFTRTVVREYWFWYSSLLNDVAIDYFPKKTLQDSEWPNCCM